MPRHVWIGIVGSILSAGAPGVRAQPMVELVSVRGAVIAGDGGQPIGGASVTVEGQPGAAASTDAAGEFTLEFASVAIAANPLPGREPRVPGEGPASAFRLDGRWRQLAVGPWVPGNGRQAGMHLARGAVGARAVAAVAKPAAAPRLLVVSKAGYGHGVLSFDPGAPGRKVVKLYPRLAPSSRIKVISDQAIPSLDWGRNVAVQVWDGDGIAERGTRLKGDHADASEGPQAWLATFSSLQERSAWAFVAPDHPEDLSNWSRGALRVSLKGSVPSLGILVASPGAPETKVDAAAYGYRPDGRWHLLTIPLSAFPGTDFRRVSIYCAFYYPLDPVGGTAFDPALSYIVDDVYFTASP